MKAAAAGRVVAIGGPNFKDNPKRAPGSKAPAPGENDGGGWGNFVVIDHGGGFLTLYAHMEQGSMLVDVGDPVGDGQQIGNVGNTGHSFGAHAHVEAIYNQDGSQKYAGSQYKKGDKKNAHVFSLEEVGDLQKILNGEETVEVTMLNGDKKTLGKITDLEEVVITANRMDDIQLKPKPADNFTKDLPNTPIKPLK